MWGGGAGVPASSLPLMEVIELKKIYALKVIYDQQEQPTIITQIIIRNFIEANLSTIFS